MLLDLGGKPLIRWAWDAAVEKFGAANVVVACPMLDAGQFHEALPGTGIAGWWGPDRDVLGRLQWVASNRRAAPQDIIHRITPDDWPPVLDRDVTTLSQLKAWDRTVKDPYYREHVGYLFHPNAPREINTLEDLEAVREKIRQESYV